MPLHCWCYTLGLLLLISGAACALTPGKANILMAKFCRCRTLGIILTLIAWVWAGHAVWVLPIDFITPYRKYIPYLVLVCAPLTCISMANLLPCRALGAILVLYPYTLLLVARSHTSDWRLVIITIAYISIIKGMILILYPWKMRQSIEWTKDKPLILRIGGFINFGLGATLIYLGMTTLR